MYTLTYDQMVAFMRDLSLRPVPNNDGDDTYQDKLGGVWYFEPMKGKVFKSRQLNININADNEGAVLTINGEYRYITPSQCSSEQDFRNLLQDHPNYVYNAVVAMLKEMAE
jgi:hypothetical protein